MGKVKLPASISKLCHLQTLIVYQGNCRLSSNILYLPPEIWKMPPEIRHLSFKRSFLPCPSGDRDGKSIVVLENLQTLTEVLKFRCTKEFIIMMLNLKKLGISYYHDESTQWSCYCRDNFVHLENLEILKCVFIPKYDLPSSDHLLALNLAFPPSLKKLTLSGCVLPWKHMTIVGSLPNLEVLKLKDNAFKGPVWELNEGEFCQLKFLFLIDTDLEHLKADETHFLSLQWLTFSHCSQLAEIPCEIVEIPTLQVIEVYGSSLSALISAKFVKEEQQREGNDSLQIYFGASEFLRCQILVQQKLNLADEKGLKTRIVMFLADKGSEEKISISDFVFSTY
ncbi:putative late blight resistance protein-like protein R1A-4 [Forsythia ovata]|uniref:Late blight resistance protein-like protein R1A-4 n=1 Tax=Forsythia ovata TaxID=205694 RepID=A0ABD1TQ37_9LAMI